MAPRTAFGVKLLDSRQPAVRRLKRAGHNPGIHGNKVWDSSLLLMHYLRRNPPPRRARILEIGCGWGPTGIFCAKTFGARVTGLDADPAVFPFLNAQAEANGVQIQTRGTRFERVTGRELAEFDWVIGSDICFWESLERPLYNLVRRALKAGVDRVVLADPGRQPFFNVADRCEEKLEGDWGEWRVPHPHRISGYILEVN